MAHARSLDRTTIAGVRYFRGSLCIVAVTVVVTGCSARSEGTPPGPETVTVTYSSSTSNAPTTQTVTSSPSSTRGPRTTTSPAASSSSTSSSASSASASSTSGTPSSTSTSTSSPTGTQTSSPSSSTSPDDEARPSRPGDYADAFIRAWGRGDRASAATYGTAAAVSALFGQMPAGGPSWRRASTTEYAGSSEVTYSDGSRSLTVVVDHGRLGSGADPAVTSAVLTGSSTPTDAPSTGAPSPTTTSYADSFGQTGNGDGRT